MLEIKNITIAYGKKSIVCGNLYCSFGQITALTGLSGTGKTTILNTIAGISKVSTYENDIINDIVVSDMNTKQQKHFLYRSKLSIASIVDLPRSIASPTEIKC